MKGVKYTGTWLDFSGYGQANRMDIVALHNVNVDVTTELLRQVPESTDFGWCGVLCSNLKDRDIPYKIKIIHLTPDMYSRYMEKDVYHIGRLFWETDKLPQEWIDPCNKMGEIWTSSEAMAQLYRASGVKVPIYSFPEPIDTALPDKPQSKFILDEHHGFLFYSVFQWIERKNPRGLLEAYWKAFSGREDVSLLLKTYRVNYAEQEKSSIINEIKQWKQELRLGHYPRVLFAHELLSQNDIMALHNLGDCYVSADHGEGWSRTVQEALLMGKPVVSTARGGIHEYLNDTLYFPIKSKYVPVVEQPWIKFYRADQNWAEPDQKELMETMKWVFENKELAGAKGIVGKNFVKDNFNFYNVGLGMRKRLEKIYSNL